MEEQRSTNILIPPLSFPTDLPSERVGSEGCFVRPEWQMEASLESNPVGGSATLQENPAGTR